MTLHENRTLLIDFEIMLKNVAEDDKLSFKTDNSWLNNHPKNALLFADTEKVWQALKQSYTTEFKALVYGDFPEEQQVLKSLMMLSQRLHKIESI